MVGKLVVRSARAENGGCDNRVTAPRASSRVGMRLEAIIAVPAAIGF
jgi:hypothetical protein